MDTETLAPHKEQGMDSTWIPLDCDECGDQIGYRRVEQERDRVLCLPCATKKG